MISSTAFWAASIAAITGLTAVWANPRRVLNRALLGLSLPVAFWMLCQHLASVAAPGDTFWARAGAMAMAALLPVMGWLKEVMLLPGEGWRRRLGACRLWLAVAAVLCGWAAWPSFLPPGAAPSPDKSGTAGFLAAIAAAGCWFAFKTAAELRQAAGVRRAEVQVLLTGMAAATAVAVLGGGYLVWEGRGGFVEPVPLAVAAVLMVTVWALTSVQVLEARHLAYVVCERLALVALVAVFMWSVQLVAQQMVHPALAFVLALSISLLFAAEVYPWMRAIFRRGSRTSQLRHRVAQIAGEEMLPEAMEDAFLRALREGTDTERAVILMASQSRLAGGGLEFQADEPVMRALQALHWVTPERLERAREVPSREAFAALFREHGLGLLVANRGPSVSFVVALGERRGGRPFTRPEILRMLDVAVTIEHSLSRARYQRQARHAEQLAIVGMLGASIAHEIRNPLVSIKTFVQLLPKHHEDPVFRDKFFNLIGGEVSRIDRLTQQLLDLSAPKALAVEPVELHPLLKGCLDLVGAKADHKRVKLVLDFQATPDRVQIDPSAVKQVILNLCFNAIQAQETQEAERWVRVKTSKAVDNVEIEVSDNGPGIAPEVWGRLFQPFQSTKSNGFGLGLAICKDILSSLHANITADPPVIGRGAVFRITLPCPPSTS